MSSACICMHFSINPEQAEQQHLAPRGRFQGKEWWFVYLKQNVHLRSLVPGNRKEICWSSLHFYLFICLFVLSIIRRGWKCWGCVVALVAWIQTDQLTLYSLTTCANTVFWYSKLIQKGGDTYIPGLRPTCICRPVR